MSLTAIVSSALCHWQRGSIDGATPTADPDSVIPLSEAGGEKNLQIKFCCLFGSQITFILRRLRGQTTQFNCYRLVRDGSFRYTRALQRDFYIFERTFSTVVDRIVSILACRQASLEKYLSLRRDETAAVLRADASVSP